MKRILSLFVVLLFVVGCGGGSSETVRVIVVDEEGNEIENPQPINVDDDFDEITDTVATEDFCSSPLLTTVAPLPRGSHPAWLIDGLNALPPEPDGFFIKLRSDGTMYGNWGRTVDISTFILAHDTCRVGTRAPAFAGHWIYTPDDCLCQRFDVLPSTVLCLYLLSDSQTACSHHEITPSATGQAVANLQSSDDPHPDWYDPDIEELINEIPQVSEQVSDILTELE